MKKVVVIIISIFLTTKLSAQNIGIGTASPNASAILHVSSTNKGILFPRVFLVNASDGTTIPNPATSLIVFNTNAAMTGGTGLFYNSGTAASPNWAKVGDLKLPYYNATSSTTPAFQIENYQNAPGGIAIKGFSQNNDGVQGISGGAGRGVYAFSAAGNSLEVDGKINIAGAGQSPAQGKVLTCDANGNATWEGAIAFSSTGIQPDGAAEFSDGVEKKVAFYTEDYDYGNNYNPSTGSPYSTFTAPVKGIYHFDVRIQWGNPTGSFDFADLNIKTTYSGITKYRVGVSSELGVHFLGQEISKDLLLEAGELVFVTAKQTSGSTVSLNSYNPNAPAGGYSAYFIGRLVMKL